ncbi:MAG: excinuclease ABC subunit UvrA, partial [Desulfatiglandales bacterium]
TGVSGSGKSSLAFDTIYAEGQRRYVESLSAYARQFLELMEKPDVDSIEGLSPAISIEQRSSSKNPRSTVATSTEIYDYLRLLYARIGKPFCPDCGLPIKAQTTQEIVDGIMEMGETTVTIYAPLVEGRKGEYQGLFERLKKQGFTRVRVDGVIRRLEEQIHLDKYKKHEIFVAVDRIVLKEGVRQRITDSAELALSLAGGKLVVEERERGELLFNQKAVCPKCGMSIPELTPQMFSFNNPKGACPRCGGLGSIQGVQIDRLFYDESLSLKEILEAFIRDTVVRRHSINTLYKEYGALINMPLSNMGSEIRSRVLYGLGEKNGREPILAHGLVPYLEALTHKPGATHYHILEELLVQTTCKECNGTRLNRVSRAVKVGGKGIHEVSSLSVSDALSFFTTLRLKESEEIIVWKVIKEIRSRLEFLMSVGLNYLTLSRPTSTLSGGEEQRIRLATQISSGLAGVLYILDEPSIGLHQRDNQRLLENLKRLRDLGNTVIVVEHDKETILCADHVVDMGPGAGEMGGEVVFEGPPHELLRAQDSLTGQYLAGIKEVPVPSFRRPGNGRYLEILGAEEHNLKAIDVRIPLGTFTCVTGVSGSGKSTLINEILYPFLKNGLYGTKERVGKVREIRGLDAIDKVINIDQSPIGRTPRSNPATYTGVFTPIRELFAQIPESRARGYKPGRFSFNVPGGRCEVCQGDGIKKIEMHFLPDVYTTCDVCNGLRYNRETLEIRFKGANISDVLQMTVETAHEFFKHHRSIKAGLKTLLDVGMGYVRLGQPATTLSGGEAQRIKLARELSKRSTGATLYLLDEPTTGLHFDDINKLVGVLRYLVELGNTVVVIEHNLDVIKTADYIIDLGPEGGEEGGNVVVAGTPEEVARCSESHTGRYLKKELSL